MLSSDECKKIVLLVARPEMQVRVNRCIENEGGSQGTYIHCHPQIMNSWRGNDNAEVPVRMEKMRIDGLYCFVAADAKLKGA